MGPTWNGPRTDTPRFSARYPQTPSKGRWRRFPRLAKLVPDCRIIDGAGASLQALFVAGVWLLLAGGSAMALEAKAPKISVATVEWDAARAALNDSQAVRQLPASANVAGATPDLLKRLN